ncbi:DUF4365 domain-containing protein [Taibaiella chishuiensis]|uniref:Uncharacterized protein DUF4365 n=1 Tax=Taibaiella chishuiensis TaxID=1434707 RepID=A0A2P8CY51_9BACT|nr:DUF4365 domain-containing protein [Taibaiella chishuiensis]PSK89892.1 uncharacterized protein DUF4365 [Taibaiella chishuiensis]
MIYNTEDRIGVYSVAKIFTENLGWIFREQPVSDFGIDGFVEVTTISLDLKNKIPTGRLIGVQIKSGKSFFKENNDDHFIFRGKKKHLSYWLNHSIPVIIVLYDKETNYAYWENVNESTVSLTNKSFKIKIPKKNLLEHTSREALNGIAVFKDKYQYKLWLLQVSAEAIESAMRVKLFAYVEIDGIPNSDDYYISLVLTDEENRNYAELIYNSPDTPNTYSYHFLISNEKSLKAAIADFLPWADIFLDGVAFTDEVLTEYLANIILGIGNEDFQNDVEDLIRENSFLKLACYLTGSFTFRLDIKANELAKAFLVINNFLSKEPIVKQRVFL